MGFSVVVYFLVLKALIEFFVQEFLRFLQEFGKNSLDFFKNSLDFPIILKTSQEFFKNSARIFKISSWILKSSQEFLTLLIFSNFRVRKDTTTSLFIYSLICEYEICETGILTDVNFSVVLVWICSFRQQTQRHTSTLVSVGSYLHPCSASSSSMWGWTDVR